MIATASAMIITKTTAYRNAIVHDGGVLVGHTELVDGVGGVFVEPHAHVRRHVAVEDVDVGVAVRQLVLVHYSNGVADLVQVQTAL